MYAFSDEINLPDPLAPPVTLDIPEGQTQVAVCCADSGVWKTADHEFSLEFSDAGGLLIGLPILVTSTIWWWAWFNMIYGPFPEGGWVGGIQIPEGARHLRALPTANTLNLRMRAVWPGFATEEG